MNFRLQLALAVLVACLLAGCKTRSDTVVVHVFRDPSAPAAALLSGRIAHFQALHVRTQSGKLIVVSESAADYSNGLRELGSAQAPELVIMNSEGDGEKNPRIQDELANAIDLCTGGHRCLAFIPSWVSGDERRAAQMLLTSLLTD